MTARPCAPSNSSAESVSDGTDSCPESELSDMRVLAVGRSGGAALWGAQMASSRGRSGMLRERGRQLEQHSASATVCSGAGDSVFHGCGVRRRGARVGSERPGAARAPTAAARACAAR